MENFCKLYRDRDKNDTEDSAFDRLKTILRHVFYDKKCVINGKTKHLESSNTKCLIINWLTLCEAKLNHKSYFPHQDYFVLLRLEMQKMINELIVSSIAQPYGFCALLTGLDCRLYAMWLEHDGIYICREIQTFSLPRSFYEVFALSFYTINISSFKRSN